MRTRKPSIANLMWLVFLIALWLWITRGGPVGSRWLSRYWLAILLGGMALSWVWFIRVPQLSMRLARGDRDRQSRLLRWVVNTPAPGGLKVLARYMLAANDQVAGRCVEAESSLRAILRDQGKGLDPGFESVVRQHLADTLEALGRRDEAAAERERAVAGLGDGAETWLGLHARAQLLERGHRFAEAVALYERALASSPPGQKALHVELMMKLVLSTFNAGRPADALRWAEAVIGLDPDGPMSPGARRMAAVASNNLGRLDDAERHARAGVERAPTTEQRAEALALLGDYVMRRGAMEEAERLAREAEAMLPGRKRMPWVILGLIERERGRLEEAIRALERARAIPVGHIPALNQRADASLDKTLALNHAELGRHDIARELIERSEAVLAGDPKLSAVLDATAALVFALADRREDALARLESAERGRHAVPGDGTTQRVVLSLLGWAALLVDEPDRAEVFLRAYLDLRPDPLFRPYGLYHLGGCLRRLGDEVGGRECDREAASTDYGSRWERLARERLAAEGVTA